MKRKTIHLKVKSESCSWLNRAAVEVNQIWNYSRAVSMKALETSVERPKATWLSSFDLNNLTSGMTEFQEKTGADTIQMVCKEYAEKRRAEKKRSLRWRISKGAKRSLGWVPFKAANVKVKGNSVRFCGKTFRVFDLQRLLEYGTRKSGSFSQNSLGEWWLNVVVEMPDAPLAPTGKSVGIDLGLKSVATCSDGFKLDASQFYRKMEGKIGSAQRRGHKKQAKRLHMKVANQRKDALHKFSRKLVDENDLIVIGDVSSSKLTKTRMAKSVNDAGWYMLKTFLQYKGDYAGRKVEVVNESYTSQSCSQCGCLSGPQGLSALRVREWTCEDCGTHHDRDENAARNILTLGSRCRPPSAGTSFEAASARMDRAEAA